ncbi:hypothetical protein [Methylomonas sp. AM2-LC]|uniref:hypothetical protein n=1 Tax=Methylomonas sp. AM2-LC TaxID=3153301 RepID=UPI0032653C3F
MIKITIIDGISLALATFLFVIGSAILALPARYEQKTIASILLDSKTAKTLNDFFQSGSVASHYEFYLLGVAVSVIGGAWLLVIGSRLWALIKE